MCAEMWNQQSTLILQQSFIDLGLPFVHIQTNCCNLSGVQRFRHSGLVDNCTSSGVDNDNTRSHLCDLLFADKMCCTFGQWHVDGNNVAVGQQLVEGDVYCSISLISWKFSPIVVNCIHAERSSPLHDCLADTAHSKDTQCLPLRVMSKVNSPFEVTLVNAIDGRV